jgi:hypothetical protein
MARINAGGGTYFDLDEYPLLSAVCKSKQLGVVFNYVALLS